jgi:hypothetical protein
MANPKRRVLWLDPVALLDRHKESLVTSVISPQPRAAALVEELIGEQTGISCAVSRAARP